MRNFKLEIGGIPLIIKSCEPWFIQMIAEKYRDFALLCGLKEEGIFQTSRSSSHPPVHLQIDIRQKESEKWNDMLDETLWVDVSYHNKKFIIRRPDLEGDIDFDNRIARVTNRAAVYSFDSFLRILYSLFLVQEGGFLLHAASVVRDGQGYLFMGKSGAGKSTIAIHSSKYTVLSDEISLVKKAGADYLVYSTPFWGEQEIKGRNYFSPLAGIYRLKQSSQLLTRKLSEREALCRLMENILYFSREPFLTRQLFQNCTDLIQQVAIYELEFQKDSSFWNMIG